MRRLLASIKDDSFSVKTSTIDELFSSAVDKDGLFLELNKLQYGGYIVMHRATGIEHRYNIFSLQVTPKGLCFFDEKKEAKRISGQQLRYSVISGCIASVVGAFLGWMLSCITIR